jgi:hypothetical protein
MSRHEQEDIQQLSPFQAQPQQGNPQVLVCFGTAAVDLHMNAADLPPQTLTLVCLSSGMTAISMHVPMHSLCQHTETQTVSPAEAACSSVWPALAGHYRSALQPSTQLPLLNWHPTQAPAGAAAHSNTTTLHGSRHDSSAQRRLCALLPNCMAPGRAVSHKCANQRSKTNQCGHAPAQQPLHPAHSTQRTWCPIFTSSPSLTKAQE